MSLVFIIGGARSGKSSFALELSKGDAVAFIATALPLDEEMKERIERHKIERPSHWKTIEAPEDIMSAIKVVKEDCIILDCLTLWVSNLIEKYPDKHIVEMAEEIAQYVRSIDKKVIVVSNEVGLSIVPEYPLARRYRDTLGKVNQIFAKLAQKVYFMVAGIPMEVKNET
ncbi:MAG: bifunctional adenosylcobinamide kinase/adenosylcobinamide-phosphate guanylyltransferase [bacterium]